MIGFVKPMGVYRNISMIVVMICNVVVRKDKTRIVMTKDETIELIKAEAQRLILNAIVYHIIFGKDGMSIITGRTKLLTN